MNFSTMLTILWRLLWLAVAGLFLIASDAKAVEEWTCVWRTGSGNNDVNLGFQVRNQSTSPVTFRFSSGGAPATNGQLYDVSYMCWLSGSVSTGMTKVTGGNQSPASTTIAAGATVNLILPVRLNGYAGTVAGSYDNWSVTINYYENGASKTATLARSGVVVNLGASFNASTITGHGEGAITTGVGVVPNWGKITVGAAPVHGSVEVAYPEGPGRVIVTIDGETFLDEANENILPTPPATVFVPHWSTSDPGSYVGKEVKAWLNGKFLGVHVIALDADGSFDISYLADTGSYPEAGTLPDPPTPPKKSDAPANTVEGQYSGRNPGAPGVDAKTNTSAPDTTKEMYEAVRQGTEDALNGNAGLSGDLDKPATDSAAGSGIGAVGAGALDAVKSAADMGVPGAALGGTSMVSSVTFPFIYGHSITWNAPDWAFVVRWFIQIFVTLWMAGSVMKLIRQSHV